MKPKLNVNQPEKDRCYTPAYAVDALLEFLHEKRVPLHRKSIYEPAVGQFHIQKVVEPWSKRVLYSDIEPTSRDPLRLPAPAADFLDPEDPTVERYIELCDAIITNPPYTSKLKQGFIERCVDSGKDFALLMPLETLASKKAQLAFEKCGGISILVFDSRVDFIMPGMENAGKSSAQFPVAWFISGFHIGRHNIHYKKISEKKADYKKSLKDSYATNN